MIKKIFALFFLLLFITAGSDYDATTSDYVEVDSSTGAKFFSKDSVWTYMMFFNLVQATDVDQRSLFGKWSGVSGNRYIHGRIDNGTEPYVLETWVNSSNLVGSPAANVYESTWYLYTIQCDGNASSTSLTYRLYNIPGDTLVQELTGSHVTTQGQAGPVIIGAREDNGKDPFYGCIDWVAYVSDTLTTTELTDYMTDPSGTISTLEAEPVPVRFFYEMGAAGTIEDLSASNNDATANGVVSCTGPIAAAPATDKTGRLIFFN